MYITKRLLTWIKLDFCYKVSIHVLFELRRERATEAIVFLVADLNRSWAKDAIRCAPVCWFTIHIPCQLFDGQWHGLVTRTIEGRPLTAYQLQKNVWKEVEQMKKPVLVAEFKKINRDFKWTSKHKDFGARHRIVKWRHSIAHLPWYPTH